MCPSLSPSEKPWERGEGEEGGGQFHHSIITHSERLNAVIQCEPQPNSNMKRREVKHLHFDRAFSPGNLTDHHVYSFSLHSINSRTCADSNIFKCFLLYEWHLNSTVKNNVCMNEPEVTSNCSLKCFPVQQKLEVGNNSDILSFVLLSVCFLWILKVALEVQRNNCLYPEL